MMLPFFTCAKILWLDQHFLAWKEENFVLIFASYANNKIKILGMVEAANLHSIQKCWRYIYTMIQSEKSVYNLCLYREQFPSLVSTIYFKQQNRFSLSFLTFDHCLIYWLLDNNFYFLFLVERILDKIESNQIHSKSSTQKNQIYSKSQILVFRGRLV